MAQYPLDVYKWVNSNLYRLMYKEDLYIIAYERIKSAPGNLTPGSDKQTIDGFSLDTIHKIIREMQTEQFQLKPVRTVYIPKSNGKKRKLGIPSTRDKIVQEVIRTILECIYDSPKGPYFHEMSHGFRPNRSCHTALREIRGKWPAINWFLEGDIQSCFDAIDHGILVRLLRKKIRDERFLNLIWKLLRAGYLIATLGTVFVTDPNTGATIRTGDIIPEPAIDPASGQLYVVWQDAHFNGGKFDEVALSTSTNGGATWSAPIQVNMSTPSNRPGFTPAIHINSAGTVGVTFYDFRNLAAGNTTTLPTDYWLTTSTNHGASFGNEVHIAGSFDMLNAPYASGFFVGDYEGLSTIGTTFQPFFVQTNSGNTSNRTDVFTTSI
jgi:hypothetical protein